MMSTDLKNEFLRLLEKDIEFRYAVAGYLGLSEIIKKLDWLIEEQRKIWEEVKHIWEEIKSLREDQHKLWENQNRLWEEVKSLREGQEKLWENQNRIWEEIRALRENQNKIWEEIRAVKEDIRKLWENQNRMWEEIRVLRENQNKVWEEIRTIKEDIRKLWENQNRMWEEIKSLRENQYKLWEEVRILREDFSKLIKRIDALGSRWGILAESAFRNALKGLLEKSFNVRIERWINYDDEGFVYGYPSVVEIDIALRDQELLLIEVSSHAKIADISLFNRKAIFYEKKVGKKPSRLIFVTPYAENDAIDLANKLRIELYTSV
jgi:hypothetical protein